MTESHMPVETKSMKRPLIAAGAVLALALGGGIATVVHAKIEFDKSIDTVARENVADFAYVKNIEDASERHGSLVRGLKYLGEPFSHKVDLVLDNNNVCSIFTQTTSSTLQAITFQPITEELVDIGNCQSSK
jgi:hypothetical protein